MSEWQTNILCPTVAVLLVLANGFFVDAMSPCAFCLRGVGPCPECHRHGHFDYEEICEACLGLGVCRCDFCNSSGFCSIEEVPRGLRVPVIIARVDVAVSQIDHLADLLPIVPATDDPSDFLKQQGTLILRLNGLLGLLEDEIDDARDLQWWTPNSNVAVSSLVDEWRRATRSAEERICAAFQSMADTATRMASDSVDGSRGRQLAQKRAEFFHRFATFESLELTDPVHPVLDRILIELGLVKLS